MKSTEFEYDINYSYDKTCNVGDFPSRSPNPYSNVNHMKNIIASSYDQLNEALKQSEDGDYGMDECTCNSSANEVYMDEENECEEPPMIKRITLENVNKLLIVMDNIVEMVEELQHIQNNSHNMSHTISLLTSDIKFKIQSLQTDMLLGVK